MHLSCTNCQKKNWGKIKRGAHFIWLLNMNWVSLNCWLARGHFNAWIQFRVSCAKSTHVPVKRSRVEWQKYKTSILLRPWSGSNCSLSFVFMRLIVINIMIWTTTNTWHLRKRTATTSLYPDHHHHDHIPATLRERFVCVGLKSRRSHLPSSQAVATPIAAKGKASKRRLFRTKS